MKLNQWAATFVVAFCSYASADAITIPTVPVGNPGNAADTRYTDSGHPSGVGAVAQSFNIGTTEITNAQYVTFLNAVGAVDPYGLYSTSMASATYGGIVRSGSSGSYNYAVKNPALGQGPGGLSDYVFDDKPVVFVSAGDAMRFANWLNHGQPTGVEDASTTEDGAYTLNGATTNGALAAVARNAGALWWLPSENEWYKAAYHKNDGITSNYWNYPTGTDSVPNNNPPSADTGNSANFNDGVYTTGNSSYPLTDAGAYTLSDGPYETYDQGGNVWEWNETLVSPFRRGVRGGSWRFDSSDELHASIWVGRERLSGDEVDYLGFRVASIPEPSTMCLGLLGAASLLLPRRRT